jgi:hypothetical protein
MDKLQSEFDKQESAGLWLALAGMVIILIILIVYYRHLDWSKTIPRLAFLILGAIAIDASIHATLTSPFEISSYWPWKLASGALVGVWMLGQNLSYPSIAIASIGFAGLISIYYRSLELLTGYPIGEHVPTWVLGNKQIAFDEHPWVSTVLWAITHTSAWAIPSLILKSML